MEREFAYLFSVVFSFLFLIFLGYLLKKTGLVREEGTKTLNNIIVYLTMPAFIFMAIYKTRLSFSLLIIPLLAFVVAIFLNFFAFGIGRNLNLKPFTLGALILAASYGNTGYLGYPLSLKIFGKAGLTRAFFYDLLGTVILIFTIGLFVAETFGKADKKANKLKEIVTFPPLVALFLAILLKGISFPSFLATSLNYLSSATVPLIMFSVGLALSPAEIFKYKLPLLVVIFLKLVVSPLFAYLAGVYLFRLASLDLGVSVLEAATPTMLFSLIIAERYRLDSKFLASAILVTTILSIITIPVFLVALGLV